MTREVELLRAVYEAARAVERYNGVDPAEVRKRYDQMLDAIERVKAFDGGYDDQ